MNVAHESHRIPSVQVPFWQFKFQIRRMASSRAAQIPQKSSKSQQAARP